MKIMIMNLPLILELDSLPYVNFQYDMQNVMVSIQTNQNEYKVIKVKSIIIHTLSAIS